MIQRISSHSSNGQLFSEPIADNRISGVQLLLFEAFKGEQPLQFQVALVETAPGKSFPYQLHTGGDELAVVLEGLGKIEIQSGEDVEALTFGAGDVLRIPPDIVYRVCNDSPDLPLRARIFFPAQVRSYWPDGRSADTQEASAEDLPEREEGYRA